jgi:hypothetical protein
LSKKDDLLRSTTLFTTGPPEGFDGYPHSDILNDSYRKWNNEFRAPNEEKIQIPKIFTPYGFK